MIDPAGRANGLVFGDRTFSTRNSSLPSSSESFAAELSDQFGGTKQSVSSRAERFAGQESVAGQAPVAGSASAASTDGSASRGISNVAAHVAGVSGLVSTTTFETKPAATSGTVNSPQSSGAQSTTMSFDESYWANQPPAVQELQDINDPSERAAAATQLASEGYTIDVPIMVWGWDPQITTELRQSMGYTWVPSAEQKPVEVAPGLTANGASYNPNSPPAGSIMV
jgi:hypothetical protein